MSTNNSTTTTTWTLPPSVAKSMRAEVTNKLLPQLGEIAKRLESLRGTAAEVRKQAVVALTEAENKVVDSWPVDSEVEYTDDTPFTKVAVLSAEIDRLTALRDEAKQACDDAVVRWLKSRHSDTTSEREALVTQYKTLKASVDNIASLTGDSFDVPALPKATSGSSGTRVKTSQGRHYHVTDSGREYYSNDTFSGLAWYAFGKCGVEALKAAVSAAGVSNVADPWEATLTINGKTVTVGHEVSSSEVNGNGAETTTDEQTDEQ